MTTPASASPRWNTSTKFLVALVLLVLIGALLYRFQVIIGPLVMAFVLTYLLRPAVEVVHRRTGIGWGWSVNLTFLVLVVVLLGASTALGFAVEQQAEGLYQTVLEIVTHLPDYLARWTSTPVRIGPFILDFSQVDLAPLNDQIISFARSAVGQAGTLITVFFSKAFTVLGWMVFILVVSYYLLHDFQTLGPSVERMGVPGYHGDFQRLRRELEIIWNAFLRGQFLLGVAMGVATAMAMTVLGVRYSLVLGLLAGFLEFIPIIGPFIAGAVAVLVAFFQPGNWLGLSPLVYAGVVALASVLLQQFENNFLVPRILGRSLNLHPVLIMVGAIIGASLAGVLGLLLSAPLMATARLLGRYAYRKLFDLTPFPEVTTAPEPPVQRHAWIATLKGLIGRRMPASSRPATDATEAPAPADHPTPDGVGGAPPLPRAPAEASPPMEAVGGKVLLVDDDPDILELLELSLKRAGYDVVTARDGDEALRRLTTMRPALILLDLMMPGSDGYETLGEVRRLTRAPVIVVSALSDSREITRALDAGAMDYLAKPFHPSELVSRVGAVLRRTGVPEGQR